MQIYFKDNMEQTNHRGIQTSVSPEGVQLVRIHYSADLSKDPDTPEGKAWLKRELQGYRGVNDARWRKEMEVDFDAQGGQLLFPYLLSNTDSLFVEPYQVSGTRLISGLDYGVRNPSAFEVLSIDSDNKIHVLWEYYEEPKKAAESDDAFRARKGYKNLCTGIKSCPYYDENLVIYADPSIWNKSQESMDSKGLMSIADLFKTEGIQLTRGQRGRDFACYEHIDKNLWLDPKNPLLTISKECPWLWYELQKLRFAEYGAGTQISKNLQEKIVDRDNHAFDAIKYAISEIIKSGFFDDCDFN